MTAFNYDAAFSRNIGWVSESEQQVLRGKRIAIAGMGGVGGIHLLTLTRLGIGAFHLADFDTFEIHNFNRQAGATLSHLDRPKVQVMAELARDINPALRLDLFPDGVTPANLDAFLADVDLYVDGLDFFAFEAREMMFQACAERGIPAITVAPLGMGAALLNFLPGSMTFEDYFQLAGQPEPEKGLRFLLGLAPAGLHFGYLVDPSRVDLANHRGPSTGMACQLCAGVAGTEALKILLQRGRVHAAPYAVHFDAYQNRLKITWRPGGNRNPMQRLALAIGRKRLSARFARVAPPAAPAPASVAERLLDLARWAPSGDNTQPWRFEVVNDHHLRIHGFDTREHCVYDLDGRASQIAHGALLETLSLAASGEGLRATISRQPDCPDTRPIYEVHLAPDPQGQPSPLLPYIKQRTVQRRALKMRALTDSEKSKLQESVGDGFKILWLTRPIDKWRMARLLWANAKLRLTMPEAYQVHRAIIDWGQRYSEDKVPDQAIGLDSATLKLMRWVMASWARVRFFNRYLAGTFAPRLQLDLLPALRCGGHFALVAHAKPDSVDDYVAAGRALQRFWLQATRLGLQLQPEMTPLIFSRYAREQRPFTSEPGLTALAQRLAEQSASILGDDTLRHAVFLARLGAGPAARSRSLRRSVAWLRDLTSA